MTWLVKFLVCSTYSILIILLCARVKTTVDLQIFKCLVACCHSFIFFYINQAYIQYFIYNTRRVPLLISSLLPLGRGPPLGCRAEIRTRACHTARRRRTAPTFSPVLLLSSQTYLPPFLLLPVVDDLLRKISCLFYIFSQRNWRQTDSPQFGGFLTPPGFPGFFAHSFRIFLPARLRILPILLNGVQTCIKTRFKNIFRHLNLDLI